MSARNLKLRAIENGVYDKFHLTRVRFELPPDLMTTDMGNSYLALRTTLRDAITRQIIDTHQDPNEVPIFHTLGDGITAYDGTALFRTAKLFNKATGAVIEELNYNNIRTNTFKEFTNDFENIASNTIQSGMGIPDSLIPNLQSVYTLWTNATNSTVELHIPLKSIFPSLNVPFFQLSAVGGLIVDLELDTTHPLVMSYSEPALVIPPPRILTSGRIGFNTVAQEEASWLVREQINSRYAPIEEPFAVFRPEYWEFPREDPLTAQQADDRYWDALDGLVYGVPDPTTGDYAGVQKYKFGPKRTAYTLADVEQLTLNPPAGTPTFTEVLATLITDDEDIPFRFAAQIEGLGVDSESLLFAEKHIMIREGSAGVLRGRLDAIYSPLPPFSTKSTGVPQMNLQFTDLNIFIELRADNVLTITQEQEGLLLESGILRTIDGITEANEETSFTLYLQSNSASGAGVYMCPDTVISGEGLADDVIHTNQKYQLPFQALQRLNVDLYTNVGGVRKIRFSEPLNLDFVEGVRPSHNFTQMINVVGGDAREIVPAASMTVFFQSVRPTDQPPLVASLPHYPSCDLAEMVLVQYPPMKTQMPKFYRTVKVEPFVIPTGMNQFIQNFMLEPNVYNAFVLLPYPSRNTDISTFPSLISGEGNVIRFRASIDEVDVVNKDIGIGGFPDSLYWDKLADAFSNSSMALKTLSGSAGEKSPFPVRVLPIRIYGGLVDGVVSFSNFMKRLQVRMESEQPQNLQSGTAYLFKELYKSY